MTEIITVVGNIATDPEQRSIAEGVAVTSFRLASTHRRFDRASSSWVDAYTNYFTVSAFRSLGAHAYSSLHRGERVVVSGRLRLREWDNGTRRGMTAEIDADSIGHDLLWGVTSYRPDGRDGDSPHVPPPAAPAGLAPVTPGARPDAAPRAATDDDGWAIPAGGALVAEDVPF